MRKLTFILLTIMIFSLPWDNTVTFPFIGSIGRVIGILVAVAGILTVLLEKRIRRIQNFHVILLIFFLWGCISYFWSVAPDISLNRLFTNIQLLVFVWLIWEFTRDRAQFNKLLQSYVLGAYIPVGILIYNYIMGNMSFIGRYSIEGLNPNFLSVVLIVGIIFSTYLSRINHNKAARIANMLYIPIAIFSIFLTGSRTGLIITLVSLIYFLWTYSHNKGMKSRVLILIFVVSSAYVVLINVPEATWTRLATLQTEVDSGDFGNRAIIWQKGLENLNEYFINGVGIGAYGSLMRLEIGYSITAHNSFISVLLELGLIGLALFIILLMYIFMLIIKCPNKLRVMWIYSFVCILIGMNFLSWEYGKILWLMFGIIPVSLQIVKHEKGIWGR